MFETNVIFKKCIDYDLDRISNAIKEIFDELPPPEVEGKTILLKPNLVVAKKPETATCTHPIVVYAVIKALQNLGAKRILVGDSPMNEKETYNAQVAGVYAQVAKAGAEWTEFKSGIDVSIPSGRILKSITLTENVKKADVVISIAKLKTHSMMGYTGAMKNLFGTVIGKNKAAMHGKFPEKMKFSMALNDIVLAVNPQYAIVDGIWAMEGNGGPTNGNPTNLGVLAASRNILALDWKCAELIGYEPNKIANLNEAMSRKYWLKSPEEISLCGDDFEKLKPAKFQLIERTNINASLDSHGVSRVRKIFKAPLNIIHHRMPAFYNMLLHFVGMYPSFAKRKCIQCKRCIDICPNRALSTRNIRIIIDKNKCIRCFCCHEICPNGAVVIKRGI
ncbi:MAG: DUF362 domain-containing protein [Spirochaetaceae bacterium]|jgi:uncharacterized protein (DUF362 family)/Pyruvate/2-oxoacid:ferredoxin oxidoreductase delta subunit|nr:DUF362 domain-containing protein [Spirochaetaceae bacterium]